MHKEGKVKIVPCQLFSRLSQYNLTLEARVIANNVQAGQNEKLCRK